ncbi:HIT family protein [Candidatus Uhrbacteria bacterium]|nr:HIT family protein [Candidatus Uhrbacteria bacterium]
MDVCLFCKIAAHEIPSTTLYEDEHTIAFLDIHPVKPGHTLVVPKAHAADVCDSRVQDLARVIEVVQKITPAILKTVGATGFNFSANTGAAAGQVIFHTHFHLIPRHDDDGLLPWKHEGASPEALAALGNQIRTCL